MSGVDVYERRLLSALNRIRDGVAKIERPAQAQTSAAKEAVAREAELQRQINALQVQLEEARRGKDALEADVMDLKGTVQKQEAELTDAPVDYASKLAEFSKSLDRLRGANAELRSVVEKITADGDGGASDPALVNRAMAAELDALRAQQAADAQEVRAILEAMAPLIEEAPQ